MKRIPLLLLILLLSVAAVAGELKPYRGDRLPPFVLEDIDGKQYRLSDYRGKVVLVNFWATWCAPCVKEMPTMQRLKSKLGEKELLILAVNMGDDDASVRDFLKKIPLSFPILMDRQGSVSRQWKVYALPTSFVLDAKGTVTYVLFGSLEWDTPEVAAQLSSLTAVADQ